MAFPRFIAFGGSTLALISSIGVSPLLVFPLE